MSGPHDAVVLVSFGGPRQPSDVMTFLRNVTQGRGIPDDRLAAVAEHYYHFGGASPINEQTEALAKALAAELAHRGRPLPVRVGNRNWTPYLADTLASLADDGHRRVLAVLTSAYASYSSCRQYLDDIDAALNQAGLVGRLEVTKVRQYFNHPGFIAPFATGLAKTLDDLADTDPTLTDEQVAVFFTGHSLPVSAARSAGFGGSADGAYVAGHLLVAEQVMAELAAAPGRQTGLSAGSWQLVYQSRSGPPGQAWLEPDINEAIEQAARQGVRAVVAVPIGFISDHMEVVWDLDIEASQTAARLGLAFGRVPTPGIQPGFVAALADLVDERQQGSADGAHVGIDGPWPAPCPRNCCPRPVHGRPR